VDGLVNSVEKAAYFAALGFGASLDGAHGSRFASANAARGRRTAEHVIAQLNAAIVKRTNAPESTEALATIGIEGQNTSIRTAGGECCGT
jgi:hypothetical protein